VNYGLLTDARGCPVAVSVFEGNTGDPKTLMPQVEKVREDFGIASMVMVGDRGMISNVQIEAMRKLEGTGWITALKNGAIAKLADAGQLQLDLFDERNLISLTSEDYPGVTSGVNSRKFQRIEFRGDLATVSRVVCAASPGAVEDATVLGPIKAKPCGWPRRAASLDRPCARRLRDFAAGMEECSRRGPNQRMPARKDRSGRRYPLLERLRLRGGPDCAGSLARSWAMNWW
jgi:hypothetical protein